MGVVLAFLAGFLLGHFTGHQSTTTVAMSSAANESAGEEAREAEEEEAAQAEAAEAEAAEAEAAEKEAAAEEAAAKKAEEEAAAKKAAEEEAAGGKEASGGEAALAVGKGIVETTCSSCHTLSEAGATGTVGPNLDELKPAKSLVEKQVTDGGGGMPAFGGTFSKSEIEAVAEYVSKAAGSGDDSLGG
ncbi:MAG TPA: cytochrome c [Solirubrobacterales bacterium]|nr:cytochrome c [Solirubrobacterales bacterium]